MTTRQPYKFSGKHSAPITSLLALSILFVTLVLLFKVELRLLGAVIFIGISIVSLVGSLASIMYSLFLVRLYRTFNQPDAVPASRYALEDLPTVTIQLPVYNEATVVERLLRSAAAVDYPNDKLQIQLVDDSTDETTEIVEWVFQDLRGQYPAIDFQHLKRPNRKGWKAGALNYGLDRATGEFIAIFDADFVLPKDFLQRTIHFFRDSQIGLVQGRWDFINRRSSILTATQSAKLEAHQMFEQTARYWSGRWIHFHGTAGIWRKSTIESVGRWSSDTDVEDADISIRALLKDWQFVYLNDLKVMSEVPSSMGAYLTQQRRWKRGWIKIFQLYWWKILRSRAPLWVRLDLLQRLANMFSTLLSLVVSMGALPAFILGQQLGLAWLIYGLYTSLLLASLTLRLYEGSTAKAYAGAATMPPAPEGFIATIRNQIPFRLLLDMGTLWTWTVGTLEAWAGKSRFERTPKTSQTDIDRCCHLQPRKPLIQAINFQTLYRRRSRLLVLGKLFLGSLTVSCIYYAVITEHWLSILFYGLQFAGIGWVSWALLTED